MTNPHKIDRNYKTYIQTLKNSNFSGDVSSSYGSRIVQSTDNSIYQIVPEAIIYPRSKDDIILAVNLAQKKEFKHISFTARGGGTGTNGQSLSKNIIIDCTRYLNKIGTLDIEKKTINVEPGVILDQLNLSLKQANLFFAPSLSPSNRATLGGMISTDACGKGSSKYGRTSQHIQEITLLLADGQTITINTDPNENSSYKNIISNLNKSVFSHFNKIAELFPRHRRFASGYNLLHAFNGEIINLIPIISGAEGTLGIVLDATLKLTTKPKQKLLFTIQDEDISNAFEDVLLIQKLEPTSIEFMDSKIINLAKSLPYFSDISRFLENSNFKTESVTIVEIEYDTEKEYTSIIKKIQSLKFKKTNKITSEPTTTISIINNIWNIRKEAVGMLTRSKGNRKPIPFIEDVALPLEHLKDYYSELRILFKEFRVDYASYGHLDVGCIHTRPSLNLDDPLDEMIMDQLLYKVNDLVKKYKGIIWGEHGRGLRSELGPEFWTPELYSYMQKVKEIFDPNNRFNPGKIATPTNKIKLLPVKSKLKSFFNKQIHPEIKEPFSKIFSCNGNAVCFNKEVDSVMCPSYKITNDKNQSPKGRAQLLREWLRLKSLPKNVSKGVLKELENNTFKTLQSCLSCKACATACPAHIDISKYKSLFLNSYNRFSLNSFFNSYSEHILVYSYKLPIFLLKMTLNKTTLNLSRLFGMIRFTEPKGEILKKFINDENISILDINNNNDSCSNFLYLDPIMVHFEPEVIIDTIKLFKHLKIEFKLFPIMPSGKALINEGKIKKFNKHAKKLTIYMKKINPTSKIIFLDPAIYHTFNDEYSFFSSIHIDNIIQIQDFLLSYKEKINTSSKNKETIQFYNHCTESALNSFSNNQWKSLFNELNINLEIKEKGCCGMAGSFGHNAKTSTLSKNIYKQNWEKSILEDPNKTLVLGVSCREQIRLENEIIIKHPVQLIYQRLKKKL